MAIARGAGTEIIRSQTFTGIDDTNQVLIVGEQHHIYTVLSIICHGTSMQAPGNHVHCWLNAYDSVASSAGTNSAMTVFKQDMSTQETFVFNDKFSFNGYEPAAFTGPLTTAVMQDAIADQASSVAQSLKILTENPADDVSVIITFIDQNNE